MKKFIRITLILSLITFATMITLAEPPGPPTDNPADPDNNGGPVGAPIDGGLGILLAMGGAYGARKLYLSRKEKKEEKELAENELHQVE